MTQISVTRALTEVKHLTDRITRANSQSFIGVAKGKDKFTTCLTVPSETVDSLAKSVKANLTSAIDLISRRERLKREITRSNAMTYVTIAGISMTVADAIEKKAAISYTQHLVQNLRSQLYNANGLVEKSNTKLLEEINVAVTTAYGNEKGKVEADQYDAVAKPRQDRSELSLIDPNGVSALIKKLEDQMADFLQEVDFILSENNSITQISVD